MSGEDLPQETQDKLRQIIALAEECLSGSEHSSTAVRVSKVTKRQVGKRKKGATEPIQHLLDSGFFSAPKTDVEVQKALRKQAQMFERNDIAVTLMRFVQKRRLERVGAGKNSDPWKYKS